MFWKDYGGRDRWTVLKEQLTYGWRLHLWPTRFGAKKLLSFWTIASFPLSFKSSINMVIPIIMKHWGWGGGDRHPCLHYKRYKPILLFFLNTAIKCLVPQFFITYNITVTLQTRFMIDSLHDCFEFQQYSQMRKSKQCCSFLLKTLKHWQWEIFSSDLSQLMVI